MQPIKLSSKFDTQIINNAIDDFKLDLKSKLDHIFKNVSSYFLGAQNGFRQLNANKINIVEHPNLPGWILKGSRTNAGEVTPDTHIYRVRKALRIQKVIDKYHFTEVVVPQKFLYRVGDQWVVLAKKMNLNPHFKITMKNFDSIMDTYKPLSPKAANELAVICFERFEDLKEENLLYTEDGKIALIDTEPYNRIMRKQMSWCHWIWPLSKSTNDFRFAIVNSEKLYTLCEKTEAALEVRNVQNQMWLKYLSKMVTAAALSAILVVGVCLTTAVITGPILTGLATATLIVASYTIARSLIDITLNRIYLNYLRSNEGHFELNKV